MITVIILYSVINFMFQSVIQPRVIGSSVGLSTTLTFLSLVFWTWVLGQYNWRGHTNSEQRHLCGNRQCAGA